MSVPSKGIEVDEQEKQPARYPSIGRLVLSVLAAAIGVQTDKNRQQDFQSSSILPYIIAGVVFTALFVVGLIVLVNIIAG